MECMWIIKEIRFLSIESLSQWKWIYEKFISAHFSRLLLRFYCIELMRLQIRIRFIFTINVKRFLEYVYWYDLKRSIWLDQRFSSDEIRSKLFIFNVSLPKWKWNSQFSDYFYFDIKKNIKQFSISNICDWIENESVWDR